MPKEPRRHFDPMATFLSGEVRVARRSGGTSEPRAPCQVGARTTPQVRLRCEEFSRRGIAAPMSLRMPESTHNSSISPRFKVAGLAEMG